MKKIEYALGGYRPYISLFLPDDYDNAKPLPALIIARGCCPGKSQTDWYEAAQSIAIEANYAVATFDYRGSGDNTNANLDRQITFRDHIDDIIAVYDQLAKQPSADVRRISVYGNSYGSDLAIRLSARRKIHALRLGVPGIYNDSHLEMTVDALMADEDRMIEEGLETKNSQLLTALADFSGNILVVEHGNDSLIPKEMVDQVVEGADSASTLRREIIAEADHWLENQAQRDQSNQLTIDWLKEINQ